MHEDEHRDYCESIPLCPCAPSCYSWIVFRTMRQVVIAILYTPEHSTLKSIPGFGGG